MSLPRFPYPRLLLSHELAEELNIIVRSKQCVCDTVNRGELLMGSADGEEAMKTHINTGFNGLRSVVSSQAKHIPDRRHTLISRWIFRLIMSI